MLSITQIIAWIPTNPKVQVKGQVYDQFCPIGNPTGQQSSILRGRKLIPIIKMKMRFLGESLQDATYDDTSIITCFGFVAPGNTGISNKLIDERIND